MKIKLKDKPYDEVLRLKAPAHNRPVAQSRFFRGLLKAVSASELKQVGFSCKKTGMERLASGEPCLVLMNHSSFIDLKIAATLLSEHRYHIVCTSDGFVGKEWLMRHIGCIPARKFQTDAILVRDIQYAVKTLKSSILMYPEASYSFDGTATPPPESLGKFIKFLGIPVVMIRTYGAFSRDPLYNNLRVRNVKVSADMQYLLSAEDIRKSRAEEINEMIRSRFSFDSFRWQHENGVRIDESFRADDLERVLYKCPHCKKEGRMLGKGESISCLECGRSYRLGEYGNLEPLGGEAAFDYVSDWFAWEREEVKKELLSESYRMETPVDVCMMVDFKSIYRVGSGTLIHSTEGFHLSGCEGKLEYFQAPAASYSLYSDYYWYEIGDVICIGTEEALYYCFPKNGAGTVAKARLAAEELYKLTVKTKKEAHD